MKTRLALALALAASAAALAHPHFPKRVEMALAMKPDAPRLAVEHLTVTFDAEAAGKMQEGDTWHLAGAKLEVPVTLKIGGKTVEDDDYRLLVRKTKDAFELVIDMAGKRFDNALSPEAIALETKFERDQPLAEHLHIDLQPAGDKEHVALFLEVRFDTMKATARIELE